LDQDEINRLRDATAQKERECQDNDARIKSIDYDLFKAHERANELSKLADAREFELRRTNDNLDAAIVKVEEQKTSTLDLWLNPNHCKEISMVNWDKKPICKETWKTKI